MRESITNRLSPIELLKRLIPFGSATVAVSGASGTTAITFPAARFTAPPLIFITAQSGGLANCIPYVASVSATGATLGMYNAGGAATSGSVVLGWIAVGV